MKYIALTLGPITRTIEMAENTRSLWAASYLFSYLGKKIIQPFKENIFLLPYISDGMKKDKEDMFFNTYKGAGVFPDRYIFKAEKGDFDKLSKHVGTVIHDLAVCMHEEINGKETNEKKKETAENEIEDYLKKYLKVYFFEKDFNIQDEKVIKESCEKSLALLEMQDSIVPKVDDSKLFLKRLFDRVTGSFLAKDAGLGGGFPTIAKISSGDNVEKPKHPYQRYIAIVKADGDSMGDAFEKASDANKLSKALFDFNKDAVNIINSYNGLPVYIGGDDLLFFAPVYAEEKKQSLFSLLQDLDEAFHANIKTTKLVKHPTLSYGVSITYYKYPMFEALSRADELLKRAKAGKSLKNNIVFSVQKHSGQTRAALLHKGNTETQKKFNELINDYMSKTTETDDKKMLSSIMHGLREKEFLLSVAIKNENTLKNYFDNNFNEAGHEKSSVFFNDVKDLLESSYNEFSEPDKLSNLRDCLPKPMKVKDPKTKEMVATPEKAAIETVYNALQFVHLVNQRNDERENI